MGLRNLTNGNHDEDLGYYANHLINSDSSLHVHLSLLFSGMITRGTAPKGLTKLMLHPIPKNQRKFNSNSDSYCGIALSSILGKLFHWVIMTDNMDILSDTGASGLLFMY